MMLSDDAEVESQDDFVLLRPSTASESLSSCCLFHITHSSVKPEVLKVCLDVIFSPTFIGTKSHTTPWSCCNILCVSVLVDVNAAQSCLVMQLLLICWLGDVWTFVETEIMIYHTSSLHKGGESSSPAAGLCPTTATSTSPGALASSYFLSSV